MKNQTKRDRERLLTEKKNSIFDKTPYDIPDVQLMNNTVSTSSVPGIDPDDCWADRPNGMRCRTCVFFKEKKVSNKNLKENCHKYSSFPAESVKYLNNNRIGRCRRHAPTINGFPVAFEEDWCGDHRIDENKV